MPKPQLKLQTTTLWEYPSQNYGGGSQGDTSYVGATPSYVIWNVLQRYSRPGDLVVDPMAGSGTTLDVARDVGRRALGYDLRQVRKDVFRADARKLPLEDGKADLVFVDPPYSDHVEYSGLPECLGELRADQDAYYVEMDKVFAEIHRILRPGRFLAVYVSDSWVKNRPFMPIGVRLFGLLEQRFRPVDHVAVVRNNASLKRRHWHTSAVEGNYFLRGFNHLMIFYKEGPHPPDRPERPADRRDRDEIADQLAGFGVAPTGAADGPDEARPRRTR